jgi:hypothetical protein
MIPDNINYIIGINLFNLFDTLSLELMTYKYIIEVILKKAYD